LNALPEWVASAEHTAHAYDLIADRYADVWFTNPDSDLADAFLAHLPERSRLLDVGCGPGQYTRHFWSRGHTAVGIDISQRTAAGARARCGRSMFARMTMMALGFPDAAFDGVWACASVPHIPSGSVGSALAELHRVLAPGGTLFVNVPLGLGARVETPADFAQEGTYGRFFQRYSDAEDFLAVLRSTGFDVVDSGENVVRSDVLAHRGTISAKWFNVTAVKS